MADMRRSRRSALKVTSERANPLIHMCAQRTLFGTHKGHQCQEGIRTWPGDYARRRAGLTVLLDSSSQLPGSSCRAAPGSGWSARSRAAARTNELDAGKRREILEEIGRASCRERV